MIGYKHGNKTTGERKRRFNMKGYVTASGFMGLVDGRYILFCSEEDYVEYITDLRCSQ